ncbi:MAG: OB-fold nucleic acid binding domain-containing protein [Candidatus ainarchaeum sp.]|nr:OB-fold nucleic acid binding domain-containing protein [Candidatus ainarchaeum sp.]
MQLKLGTEKIALAVSITGIICLFFAQNFFPAERLAIGEIEKAKAGISFETKGRINNLGETEKTLSFELYDGNKIFAIKFNPTAEERKTARENKFVKITGKKEFNGKKPEIVIEKIIPLEPGQGQG